jgi:hypothetical protein
VIWALLWTSFEFSQAARGEERNVDSTRALAAQLIAIRVLQSMSAQDVMRALTLEFDLPTTSTDDDQPLEAAAHTSRETEGLLGDPAVEQSDPEAAGIASRQNDPHQPTVSALEIAIVAEALKFIASPIVQGVLEDIWKGNVVMWGDLDVNASAARKKATNYVWRRTMWAGYARLRVPRYRFAFQVANFSILLILFLATLMQADRDHVSVQEIFLDIWFLGFAYYELGECTLSQLCF